MKSSATSTATMFEFEFMRNAFAAATIVAIVAGGVGYFLVLRGQAFAGHALAHVGFAGATGAVLLGIAPLWGMVGVTVAGGVGMGLLGERLEGRDVAIGIVLAISLGLGLLFLHFYTAYAAQATALLFGNLLGVDAPTLSILAVLSLVSAAALALMARPLLFASLQPELAEAKGVSLPLMSVLFLAIVAVTTAECAQVVGVLLVFALMVAPAAAAQQLTRRVPTGVIVAVLLALLDAWGGLVLAYYTDWPSSFWITALGGATYLLARLLRRA
jgi:zinc/manganese transport system permease protein